MSTMTQAASGSSGLTKNEKFVILASSLGTMFEWYDFFIYAVLTPFFATLFFPPGNPTWALLGALGAYAAGFIVRPFGAVLFGRLGDMIGRKTTFLMTITIMGLATFCIGLLPGYAPIGVLAPVLLLIIRLLQGWQSAANMVVRQLMWLNTHNMVVVVTPQVGFKPRQLWAYC